MPSRGGSNRSRLPPRLPRSIGNLGADLNGLLSYLNQLRLSIIAREVKRYYEVRAQNLLPGSKQIAPSTYFRRKVSLGSEAPFAKVTVVVPASTKPSGRAWRSGMDRKPVKPVSTRQVSLAVLPRPTISISSVGSPLAAKDPIATWNPRRGVGNAIHAGRANLD